MHINKKTLIKALVFISCSGLIQGVSAATATGTLPVTLTLTKSCSVLTPTPITFGPVDATTIVNSGASATGTFKVQCSKTTPYFIGLTSLNASANTTGIGSLIGTGPNTDTVAYQLRQTSASGSIWGNTATATIVGNGVAGTGNGAAQTISVYASIAALTTAPTPDTYSDTVTVTVNY
ncbi:Csu type fimbrial protein [Pseudomonas sp. MDT1-17]